MKFRIRQEQQSHINLWESIFKDDEWLNTATNKGFNLALIGRDLRKRLNGFHDGKGWYLILVSDDKEQKLCGERDQLMRSLRPHVLDKKQSRIGAQVTFLGQLGLTLNISQVCEDPDDAVPANMKYLFEYRCGSVQTSYLFYHDKGSITHDVGPEGIVGRGGKATNLTQVKELCGITLTLPNGRERQYIFHKRDRVYLHLPGELIGTAPPNEHREWVGYDLRS